MKTLLLFALLSLTTSVASAHVYCKVGSPYGQVYHGEGRNRQEAVEDTIFNCISAGQMNETACRDKTRMRCQEYVKCVYQNPYGQKYVGTGYSTEDAIEDTIFNCIVGGKVNESSCRDRSRIRCK